MTPEIYTITEDQWILINDALLAAIGICSVHAKDMTSQMLNASYIMDTLVNGPDEDAEDTDD